MAAGTWRTVDGTVPSMGCATYQAGGIPRAGEANGTFNVLVDVERLLAHGRLERVLGVGQVRQGDGLADRGLVHRAPVGGGDLWVVGRACGGERASRRSIHRALYRSYLAEEWPPVLGSRPRAPILRPCEDRMEGSSDRRATYLAANGGAEWTSSWRMAGKVKSVQRIFRMLVEGISSSRDGVARCG